MKSCRMVWKVAACVVLVLASAHQVTAQTLTPEQLQLVRAVEQKRIAAIDKVMGTVIAIYDENRQGGGSGVIIDPSGIALTNHHVIIGAGVKGWGGLADGKMYRWKLIGTDPGGDVSIIQMEGSDNFPYAMLGDSDNVKVGDWALAMGNPFVLTEDQKPTVTLGIVSGVKRYQYGAGKNQLVYGNCIQVDSSINPGNSGGPLFNMAGEVIGINGRGSFQDRGRVNVGLGYAISSNQIKNFIPDLLATKLVEHGTLDANFSDRGGKVVCSTINELSPIYEMGLRLGDELLEFEGIEIDNANQFTNLICTLPEDWPAHLKVRNEKGEQISYHTRLIGLPYAKPKPPRKRDDGGDSPEERQARERFYEMMALLSAPPGTIRHPDVNRRYVKHLFGHWNQNRPQAPNDSAIRVTDELVDADQNMVGKQQIIVASDGRFRISRTVDGKTVEWKYDGKDFVSTVGDQTMTMSVAEAKTTLPILEALGIIAFHSELPFAEFGDSLIDGSDKVQEQNSFRFRADDEDEDRFYFWFSMYNDNGDRNLRLLRASPSRDCQGEDGGVNFADWKMHDGWMVPHRRDFISGLAENSNMTSKTTQVEIVPLDEWNE